MSMKQRVSPHSTAVLAVLAGSTLFGTSGVAQALGPGASPSAVGAARVLVGGLFLVCLAVYQRNRFTVARRFPGTTVLLGASVAVYQACYFSGISRVGVAIGSIVTVATVPIATGVVAYLLRKEKPTGRWYVATLLAIAGLIASSGVAGETKADILGFVLCLTAGSSVSLYTVLSRELLDAGAPVTEVTTIAVALSGALLLPVLLVSGPAWLVTPSGALMALYLGLFTSALAFWLNARGLRKVPATAVATLNLAEPLAAVVLAFVVLGERPSAMQVVGVMAIFAGLLILTRKSRNAVVEDGSETRSEAISPETSGSTLERHTAV
ncbi:EamA family transporter [Streptomyces somaliensis]|uniref:DMT family transporter n=1 Tax=Streptomyces somaliensis TaxID=78355 RepID=UPI0020CC76E0|nr:EamA family transporter [Streptomyces somaliensis]MCP9943862.1 EamA family transporter [Streptomyces somaliensis]MCP9962891.1 EamA family transporter [Streptomyces somaliensis]